MTVDVGEMLEEIDVPEVRRNSPSVTRLEPESSCSLTTSRIAVVLERAELLRR